MKNILTYSMILLFSVATFATELKVNDPAPTFQTQTHEGTPFDLKSRKGKWTILYFYPKADTPGCTKQACAFRDSISKIREKGTEVYGVSSDPVKDLKAFHEKHSLNFNLLADPELKIIKDYGVVGKTGTMAKRWTFIIDPQLNIRQIDRDVDPVKDADKTAAKIKELQAAG